jgi:hypothetical protein
MCILLAVYTLFITAIFIVPLAVKKVGVKNGLAQLRKRHLNQSVLAIFVSVSLILALTIRLFTKNSQVAGYVILFVVFVMCLAWAITQTIWWKIFNTQYTLEQIAYHDLVDKIETKRRAHNRNRRILRKARRGRIS